MRVFMTCIAVLGTALSLPATAAGQAVREQHAAMESARLPLGWREAGQARVHASGLYCDSRRAGFRRAGIAGGLLEPAGCDYLNAIDIRVRVIAGDAIHHERDRLAGLLDGLEERSFNWAELPEGAHSAAFAGGTSADAETRNHVLLVSHEGMTLSLTYPARLEGEALEAASQFLETGLRG